MKSFFVIFLFAVAAGCAKKTAPAIDTNGTALSLALNEKKSYGSITIMVSRIQESRCPMNARCIRAGEAIADLVISDNKSSITVSLCTGADCERQKTGAQARAVLGTHQYLLDLTDIIPNPTKTLDKGTQKVICSIRKLQ
ncbi:hypothetical protein [Niabella hirudinis]|uniref:hypothetical protein n=1 Tax=Niabella hirudinis TaxID=1285929 RepID=UPI003EB84A69